MTGNIGVEALAQEHTVLEQHLNYDRTETGGAGTRRYGIIVQQSDLLQTGGGGRLH